MFPCKAFLLYVLQEMFVEMLLFQEISPAPKSSKLRFCLGIIRKLIEYSVKNGKNIVFSHKFRKSRWVLTARK